MLGPFQKDLRLYGQRFRPDDVVRIYICGPTVYSSAHVGHARAYIVGDSIRRVLRDGFGWPTRYVLNITDLDDKIIRRAREQGTEWRQVARRYEDEFWRDMDQLNVLRPDAAPRVSDYIPQIVEFVATLQSRGVAYPIASSGVYFDTQAFRAQGFAYPDKVHAERKALPSALSMEPDESDPRKKHPADFALWKCAKPDEPSWEAPFGAGRPGWHIECSAMSRATLGDVLDIHMGGVDLAFPHHANETAQSQALLGRKDWVRHFLHVGHLEVAGLKMSKSLKNFTTIREMLDKFTASQLRLFFLRKCTWADSQDLTDLALLEAVEADRFFRDSLLILRTALPDMADPVVDLAQTNLTPTADTETKTGRERVVRYPARRPDAGAWRSAFQQSQVTIAKALCRTFDFSKALTELTRLLTQARILVHCGRTSVSPTLMLQVVEYAQALLQLFGLDLAHDPDAVRTCLSAVERWQITVMVRLRNVVRAAAAQKEPWEWESLTKQLQTMWQQDLSHCADGALGSLGADLLQSVHSLGTQSTSNAKRSLLDVCDGVRTQLGALGVAVEDEAMESRWQLRTRSVAQDQWLQAELKRLRLALKNG